MTKNKNDKPLGEVVYGLHPIIELLKAKKKPVTLYTTRPEPKGFKSIEQLLPSHVTITYVAREALAKIAGTTDHQSVVALAMPFAYRRKFLTLNSTKHYSCLIVFKMCET